MALANENVEKDGDLSYFCGGVIVSLCFPDRSRCGLLLLTREPVLVYPVW